VKRMARALAAVFVGLTVVTSGWAGERPFTVVPLGIGMDGTTEQVVAAILRIHGTTGADRFVLHAPGHAVRTFGYYDEAGYRGVGRRVKAVQDAVAEKGVHVGFLMGPTMNVGINHPWTKFVLQNGQERPFTACPGDPAFRKAFAAHCAAVAAECKPFLYMMEDDFRLFWGRGCYCARHKAKPEQAMEDLVLLAEEAAKAIHRVSPDTRIGLSAPGGYLHDAVRLAKALADGGKPFIRWYGTDYGFDVPMRFPEFLWTPLWTKQNLSEGLECVYEADAAPNSPFYGSGARLAASASVMLANGYDGLWYWMGRVGAPADEPMPNAAAYARTGRDLAAVGACAREGRPVGVSAFSAAGGRLMARYGIPYRTMSGGVSVYAGAESFSGLADDAVKKILAGCVLLDGDAACELTRRGFCGLIGVRAAERTGPIDFSGELVCADKSRVTSTFHQNYGLDGSEVRRLTCEGAEEISHYFSGSETNRVQSAVTRHVNALGGRVVVLATCLRDATPTNLLNYRKRQMIVDAITWLGGESAIPVRTDKEVNVLVFANEDAAKTRLFVHATQLSCDAISSLTLVVAPPYRGGRVEVLEDGRWKPLAADGRDGRIVIPCTLHLYGTLAVRIVR